MPFPGPTPTDKPLGRLRVLSPNAGVRMSPLQFGAMSIGDAWGARLGENGKENSFKMLDAFYEAGGVSIDTANNYQDDQSEQWVGEWIEKRGLREQLVLATKYSSNYRGYDIGINQATNVSGNSRKSMKHSLEDSLKKLRTDYIDIFYLHWWDYSTSPKEVMDTLHSFVEAGKILYLGISDSPAWVVSACNTYAVDHGKTPFSVYQGQWSCMMRSFEREILPMALHFNMALAPWAAAGAGRIQTREQNEIRMKESTGRGSDPLTEDELRMSDILVGIGKKYGVEAPTSVALAYVMAKAPYVFPIVGGRKVEHLKQNIECLKVKLTDEDIAAIEAWKPFEPGFPHDFLGPDPRFDGEPKGIIAWQCGAMDYVRYPKGVTRA